MVNTLLDTVVGYESAPFPSTFCPAMVILMLVGSGKQDNDDTWKTLVQIPSTQAEAETVAVPQLLPVRELVKLNK